MALSLEISQKMSPFVTWWDKRQSNGGGANKIKSMASRTVVAYFRWSFLFRIGERLTGVPSGAEITCDDSVLRIRHVRM